MDIGQTLGKEGLLGFLMQDIFFWFLWLNTTIFINLNPHTGTNKCLGWQEHSRGQK